MNTTIKTNAIYTKTLKNGTVKTIMVVAPAEPDEKGRARYAIKDVRGKDSLILAETLTSYKYVEEAIPAPSEPVDEPTATEPAKTKPEPKEKYDKVAKAKKVAEYAVNRGLSVKAKGVDPATLFIKCHKVSMTACVNRTGITVYMRGSLARQIHDLTDEFRPQDKGRTDITVHIPDRYLDAFFATYYHNAAEWKKEND